MASAAGSSADNLSNRLTAVPKRISDFGLRLRKKEYQFLLNKSEHLGFIFDIDDRHPAPENVKLIQRTRVPKYSRI